MARIEWIQNQFVSFEINRRNRLIGPQAPARRGKQNVLTAWHVCARECRHNVFKLKINGQTDDKRPRTDGEITGMCHSNEFKQSPIE